MLERLNKYRYIGKVNEMITIRTFFAVGIGAATTVMSLYMYSFGLSTSNIGFISAGFVLISFLFAINSSSILERFKQTNILIFAIALSALSYLIIGIFNTLSVFFVFMSFGMLAAVLRTESFNIIFRDNLKKGRLNEKEGLMYSLLNVGWLLGPLIAGFFMFEFGLPSVFIFTSVSFTIGLFLFFTMNLKNIEKKRVEIDDSSWKNFLDFIKNKKQHQPYLMSLGLQVWWAMIYVYTPLLIIKNGYGELTVAIFMSLVIFPLIFLDRPIGRWSIKRGFRFFLTIGFLGLAGLSLVLFFVENIILQLGLIFLGSLFASCIEPLQDTFFFRRTKRVEEEKYYPLFGSSRYMGALLGKMLFALVLLFLSYPFVYLTMFVLMSFFAYHAFRVRE